MENLYKILSIFYDVGQGGKIDGGCRIKWKCGFSKIFIMNFLIIL